jgi:hypothetical protein
MLAVILDWAVAYALTVVLEMPCVVACAPRGMRRRAALDSLLVNTFTHPLAWLAVTSGALSWTATEAAVAVAEALAYRWITRMPWPRAGAASLLANGVSAGSAFLF